MINEKELRKGNIVKCLTRLPIGFNNPVLAHSEIVELRDNTVETNEGYYKYRDIGPIPLTEEILLNSGGQKKSDNEIIFADYNNLDIPDLIILVEGEKFYLSSESGGIYSVPIESVHQFQNLYYAIKSKEAVIKL
ncbi:hypothetical protein LJB95_02650 [Paludibacteraceae bacterium OttesenSCG-928-F17]|nr:hypothetical protein [Paludibacteraceae bacterium OttesenSCG-928-F17]